MRQTRPRPSERIDPMLEPSEQCRVFFAYVHAWRRLRSVWAAQVVQRNWRGYASRRWFQLLRRQQAACGHMQRVGRGALCRWRVKSMKRRRDHAAALIQVYRGDLCCFSLVAFLTNTKFCLTHNHKIKPNRARPKKR